MQNDALNHVLKQYLNGKKDNINFILLSLRKSILEKCLKYNLEKDEVKIALKFFIQGIDTYNFENAIAFNDYISLYLDISLKTYIEMKNIHEFETFDEEVIKFFIDNIERSLVEEKNKDFNLN